MTIGQLIIKLIADSRAVREGVDDAKRRLEGLRDYGAQLASTGKKFALVATLPLLAIATGSLDAASSLNESLSKSQVVFGQHAAQVESWSQTTADALGISQQAALEAVGTYGNLFQALGLTQQAAAEMSPELVGLAADLASFNNQNPEEVLNALRAGLTGEAEPLKRFGIALRAADVDARALAMGLIDANGAVTEAGRIMARYQIIMEQTSLAQGDFARTAEGAANSQRIMKARLDDALASLGQHLLPIYTAAVNAVSGLAQQFNNLSPAAQKIVIVVGGIVAAIGPLLIIAGALINAFTIVVPVIAAVSAVITGPLLLAIGAIIAVIAILVLAWQNNWGGIREIAQGAFQFLRGIFDAIVGVIGWFVGIFRGIFDAFALGFSGDWRGFGEKLREVWDDIWKKITELAGSALQAVIDIILKTDWLKLGKDILQGIANGLLAGLNFLKNTAVGVVRGALDAVKGFLGIQSPSKVFEMQVGLQMGLGIQRGFMASVGSLAADMQNIMGGLTPAMATAPGAAIGLGRAGVQGLAPSGRDRNGRNRDDDELKRLLRDLPRTIATVARDAILKRPK
jgi:hypothetical protein